LCIAYKWRREDVLDLTVEQFNVAAKVAAEYHGAK